MRNGDSNGAHMEKLIKGICELYFVQLQMSCSVFRWGVMLSSPACNYFPQAYIIEKNNKMDRDFNMYHTCLHLT